MQISDPVSEMAISCLFMSRLRSKAGLCGRLKMEEENFLNSSDITIRIARLQTPAHLSWIVACLFAIVCNAFLIAITAKVRTLQTKSQFVVVSLCCAEILQSIAYIGTGLKRALIYLIPWSEHVSQLACIAQSLPINICPAATGNLILALSIDRCIAIVWPLFYMRMPTGTYIVAVNLVSWTLAIMHGLLSLVSYQKDKIMLICTFATCCDKLYMLSYDISSHIRAGGTVIFQIITAVILWRRVRLLRRLSSTTRRNERKNLEVASFHAVVVIAVVYATSVWTAYMTYSILAWVDHDLEVAISPYVTLLLIFNSSSHFFVYLIMSRTFRQAFYGTVCCC